MATQPRRRLRRVVLVLLGAPLALCILTVVASALSNVGLPTRSTVVDRLTPADKARLAEADHVRQALGDAVWPEWGQSTIPSIVYNEAYAFLVGYPAEAGEPPAGWTKEPQHAQRGGEWEVVPDDLFEGQPYYRQRMESGGPTPEAFTVRVGDVWVATFQTREFAQISLVSGMREELPPVVRSVVPYRLVLALLLGDSEAYIASLNHEAFHAYQAAVAWDRFRAAENVMTLEPSYPWNAAETEWRPELDLLASAALADTDEEMASLTRQFLTQRSQRRAAAGLSDELVDFERQREWLEGLAKYAELALGRAAGTTPDYEPLAMMANDPDFKAYAGRPRFWKEQLGEVRRMLSHEGEVRFYYTGLAQAAVLDRLAPGWKEGAFDDGIWLEELLRAAVAPP